MEKSLHARVVAYLNKHKRNMPAIAKATGLGLSWMQKVADGRIPNPGVKSIEKLDDYIREQRRAKRDAASRHASQPQVATSS